MSRRDAPRAPAWPRDIDERRPDARVEEEVSADFPFDQASNERLRLASSPLSAEIIRELRVVIGDDISEVIDGVLDDPGAIVEICTL